MDTASRRNQLLSKLTHQKPRSAISLGEEFGVSRQIIVGDIALLRARGHAIRSTNRGYILIEEKAPYRRSFYIQHSKDSGDREIRAVIDAEGAVLDVSIIHDVYGKITAELPIRDHSDIDVFLEKLRHSPALNELTDGIHSLTIESEDEAALDRVEQSLETLGFLRGVIAPPA